MSSPRKGETDVKNRFPSSKQSTRKVLQQTRSQTKTNGYGCKKKEDGEFLDELKREVLEKNDAIESLQIQLDSECTR